MIAQTRPDIANATEQTVLALKEIEARIGILKGDLAVLCQGLGHAEAARIAAAPTGPAPGYGAPGFAPGAYYAPAFPGPTSSPWGNSPAFAPSPSTPFGPAYGVPWSSTPTPANPWTTGNAGTAYANPWGTAFAPFANPWASGPTGGWPTGPVAPGTFAGYNPWSVQSPFGTFGAPTTVYTTPGVPSAQNPFAAVPAGYR